MIENKFTDKFESFDATNVNFVNENKCTEVVKEEVKYGRSGYLKINKNKIIFDTSDGEYGPIEFDLQHLENMIKEHKDKLNNV